MLASSPRTASRQTVRAAIVGATGFLGVELTRLLGNHPGFTLGQVVSSSEAGKRVDDLFPALAGCSLSYRAYDAAEIAETSDVCFLAVPHTTGASLARELIAKGVVIVDASADFRLREQAVYERWYGTSHGAPELLAEAQYGLPELFPLTKGRLVAAAGCYPTASLLAAAPAVASGIVTSPRIVIDAKSGISGAGRTPSPGTHYVAVSESLSAYKVGAHRHTPEIAQGLRALGLKDARVVFVPHVIPMSRGLLATVYLEIRPELDTQRVLSIYRERYSGSPFVTVHPEGRMPSTGEVRGSNRAHIGLAVDEGTLVVTCAIDNLGKGAAGQAVQCANHLFGFEEDAGLAAYGAVI